MAKYSSDSDSERSSSKYRSKHRRRSSSLDSSDSSSSHQKRSKYSKTRRRHRSKSRDKDRGTKSYKHSRGNSREKRKYRSQRSRSSSTDRNRPKKRSASREKSTSRSSSSQSNMKVINSEKPSSISKDNFLMSDPKIKASILDDINSDEFVAKEFISSAKNKESKMKNIVVDMCANTIHVPQISIADTSNSIFHSSIMFDKEARFDRWVKKLYLLRQKAVNELNYT